MTFYIQLERKFEADQFLTKELGLKMYRTKVMTSYSDFIVSTCRNLSPLNIRIYACTYASHIFPWNVNSITWQTPRSQKTIIN